MNLVIVNENTIVVNALTIDIIKVLNGVYDVNSIEKELVNFYFNKVIIDITAIKNYFSSCLAILFTGIGPLYSLFLKKKIKTER